MTSLQTRYFGTQSLSLPTPIPVPPTFHGMLWEEVEEAEDDFYQLWQFYYVVLFATHCRSCLQMLVEDAVLAEDEKAGKSSEKNCRYPAKDWMHSKNLKPSSKVVVSASSEDSSSSDRTIEDSVLIGIVTADNSSISSGRDVGLHAGDETGTLVKLSGNVKHYQVPSLDYWKRSMDIGNDIDIVYYNGIGLEVVEEGFLYYLNQIAYGLSIPLTFFQKGVINALKSCPGQLNGNIFKMMRVCEVLNHKWRDGGIARQFLVDDVLKYYKFKYVKDRKNGYLFSDSASLKFFDFESFGRPWCDHLVMVWGNCMQDPGEPALKLIYKNFNKKPNPKDVADTSSLFDVLSAAWKSAAELKQEKVLQREQFKKEKVLQREQFEKEAAAAKQKFEDEAKKVVDMVVASQNKLIQAFYFWGLSREDVDLFLVGKYGEIVFPGDYASPVAEHTLAPPVADNPTKEEVVHLRGKVIEIEKALSRARDSINRTQQYFEAEVDSERGLKEAYLELLTKRDKVLDPARGQRAMRILFFNIKKEDRKIHAQLEIDLRHACDELERCKDVEVGNNKVENMWFAKEDEGGGVSSSKPRAEESEEEEIKDLLPHTRKTLLNSKLESEMLELQSRLNAMTAELSCKDAEILTANNESEQWKESLKKKKSETIAANQQVLDLLNSKICYMRECLKKLNWDLREARDSCQRTNDRTKTHEEACSKRDRELNEAINKYKLRIADLDWDKQALVQECIQDNEVFEELHAKYKESQRMMNAVEAEINYSREVDNKLYRLKQKMERSVQIMKQYRGSEISKRESILVATIEYVTEYDLQLVRLSYIDNLMPRVMELLNAPSTVVDAAISSPVLLSSGHGESSNVVRPKRE
ncbi:hypothetical protein GIB67_042561 [Kingdonia uniflora]|uniref:Uncharacterized protein n=1 Tax=Kingdonia uniflora TaxID=39325 RepID=A0A7J7M184_9MAGN|nr:hypothetical protein GIB67_042561 [Kingdonia uniflora]